MGRNGHSLIAVAWRVLRLAPIAFLAVFFVYPVLTIFGISLAPEGQLDLSGFARLVTSDYYVNTLLFTIWQAAISTILTLGLALPSAYVFSRFQFRGKALFLSLATLPFVLPTIVVAAAFSALIGPRGYVNAFLVTTFGLDAPPIQLERTLLLILIVHVFYNYAVALRIITTYWMNQNPRIEQAARVLGAHGWRLWWYVHLPLLRPAITAAGVLVFIFCFTSFGVVLLLGGPRYATLEVEIFRQARDLFNLPVAAALSIVQIGLMFAMMWVYTRLQRRISSEIVAAEASAQRPKTQRDRITITVTLAFMAVMLFTPLVALALVSVTLGFDGISFQHYQQLGSNPRGSVLFVPPLSAVGNSVAFAASSTALSIILGVVSSYLLLRNNRWSRLLDAAFMLPLATSAVTLGFGFIVALDQPPLNLRQSALLIPVAHTLVAMPFVIRSILPALRAIPENLREAASVLGASPWRRWRWVELPLISRALLVGATYAFVISLGEFGASLFIARPDTPTLPIAIFRLLGQPGGSSYGQALALSTILLLVSAVAFILIERLRTPGARGEF